MSYYQLCQKKKQLIEHYQQKQDTYKQQIEDIHRQIQIAHSGLSKELASLSSTVVSLNEKARDYMKDCIKSLQQGGRSKQIIGIKDLAEYLKAQKGVLKNLTEESNIANKSQLNIHQMVIRAKFQNVLKKIKKKQLQEEIKYIQTNVFSKGHLIYNPATAPNLLTSEQRDLSQKLQQSIGELQRVISLSVICNQNSDEAAKLKYLEDQTKRLKQCENLLINEYEQLRQFIQYFESQTVSIPERLPLPLIQPSFRHSQPTKATKLSQTPSEAELDQIIAIALPSNRSIGKFSHPFDSCEQAIEGLRKKFKRIEKIL